MSLYEINYLKRLQFYLVEGIDSGLQSDFFTLTIQNKKCGKCLRNNLKVNIKKTA